MIELIFWFSFFTIFYSYAGYPLLLFILCFFYKKKIHKNNITPQVSLVISAYNEETIISNKIINSKALIYPKDLLEIIVISDASEDKTDEIVGDFSGVKLLRIEGRLGKSECLNHAIPTAKGDIIVFSDANSMYAPNTLIDLVKNFADPAIGFVTGYTKYKKSISGSDVVHSVGLYSLLEKTLKVFESRIGSCVGADGAIFAIRKSLYPTLNSGDINDFVIPLKIVERKFRGILDDNVYCTEETSFDGQGEFRRQARITNRTLRALNNNRKMLNPFLTGLFSLKLISHKLCKICVPFFLLLILLSNFLLFPKNDFYKTILGIQVGLHICTFINWQLFGNHILFKIPTVVRMFIIVNLAILMGWYTFLAGHEYKTWAKSR